MPLMPYACSNCGFWQKYFAPPPDCPVCTDTRNDLPHNGWHFRPAEEVRGMLRGHWRRLERDMVAFSTSPPFGLNGTGWLLLHPDGNVAFEAAPFYTDDMLAEIERLGGIRFLASSHVHGYGALWQLQDVFRPEVLAIQKEDLRMTKAFRVTWPYDDALQLRPGLTLHHVGGHYEGQAVMYDEGAAPCSAATPSRWTRTSAARISPCPPIRPSTSPSPSPRGRSSATGA
jgi:rubredoxin